MRKLFTLFTFILLLSTYGFSQQHLKGTQASDRIKGVNELWFKGDLSIPSYIHFTKAEQKNELELFSWLRAQFGLSSDLQFLLNRTHTDKNGMTHKVYSLHYKNVPIDYLQVSVHLQNGIVQSFSGDLFNQIVVDNSSTISTSSGLSSALNKVNAIEYKWQVQGEEQWLKETTGSVDATYFPKGEAVLFPVIDGNTLHLKHAFKYDIYANKPALREMVYVDAATASVLQSNSIMKHADVTGTAHTGYSGIRQINTILFNGKYVLHETNRANGINTYNLQRTYFLSNAIDFTDADNIWVNTVNADEFATDAHWAAEMTYDYFNVFFDRNSLDDNGMALNSYVHWGEAEAKATWDGHRVLFGDGTSATLPYTTIDIAGHEFTHGLIDHTANFIYQGESGALAESFADIFGNCIENFGKPNEFSWRIGDDRGSYMRDMSNPNVMQHPDTYHGEHWYHGSNDFGGVHTNCGVHNYWFYLLAEGGNGINDNGSLYEVNGIGMQNAALIAYENLNSYLSPSSDFEDARFYSILIAQQLFGTCSPQHEAVVNAWHAVGMGDKLVADASAEFTADRMAFCSPPFTVKFENKSLYDFDFVWDFGDGTIDSVNQSPIHTYTKPGAYSVKLKIDGDVCGTDERNKIDFIDGRLIEKPTGRSVDVYEGEVVTLSANAVKGDVYWYADEATTDLLHIGSTYTTPALFENKLYFLRSVLSGTEQDVGKKLIPVSTDGSFSSDDKGLIFDLYQDVIIKTVNLHSNLGGAHKIQIRNSQDQIIYENNVLLEPGSQEVSINATVPMGMNYTIMLSGIGGNLWSSYEAEYPYETAGVISIKGSSGQNKSEYPYFYNWKVQEMDCQSEPHEVSVSVGISGVSRYLYNEVYSKNEVLNGKFEYYIKLDVPQGSSVQYGLYNISGQKMLDYTDNNVRIREETNLNELLNLDTYTGGVYFLSVKGNSVDKSKRIILKGGSH